MKIKDIRKTLEADITFDGKELELIRYALITTMDAQRDLDDERRDTMLGIVDSINQFVQ